MLDNIEHLVLEHLRHIRNRVDHLTNHRNIPMQSYYEIETEIPSNHLLSIQIPAYIPAGKARIAVIYETVETQQTDAPQDDFFTCAGIWKDSGINQDSIRDKAWTRDSL